MSVRSQTEAKVAAAPSPSHSGARTRLLQRKCACGGVAGLTGECAACGQGKRLALQTKLKINEPGDRFEQEADRVADQVTRRPVRSGLSATPPSIQRFSGHEHGHREATPDSIERSLSRRGQPLPTALRDEMEDRFGHDFSKVRVHADTAAAESTRDVHAHAYTVGQSIVFAPNQFAPETSQGRHLLAHELTHVIQQSAGRRPEQPAPCDHPVLQRAPAPDPRGAPGHRDPLIKEPATGPPPIQQDAGKHSISWSWEVDRPGTAETGGKPFRQQVYWASFEVDAHGVMRGSVRMVSPSGQFRAPEWTLRSKFKEALDTFKQHGIQVKAFEAEWSYMNPGEMSGNLDAFFKQVKRGKEIEAARATPTGTVATEHGFTDVRAVSIEYAEQQHLQRPGTQTRHIRPVVRALFALPGATLPQSSGQAVTPGGGGPKPTTGTTGSAFSITSDPVSSLPPTEPAGVGPRVTEGRGPAIAPITVPDAAVNIRAKAANMEALGAMILSGLFQSQQGAEVDAYHAQLKKLDRHISTYLSQGDSVEITVIAEVPDTIDLLAGPTGTRDQSQILYFRGAYISAVIPNAAFKLRAQTEHPQMYDAGSVPSPSGGGSIIKQNEIRFLKAKHAGHHCEFRTKVIHPEPKFEMGGHQQVLPQIDPIADERRRNPPPFVGKFRTEKVDQASVGGRHSAMVSIGMSRVLEFRAVPPNHPAFVQMWRTYSGKEKYKTERTSGTDPSPSMSARFVDAADGKVYSFVESTFAYTRFPNGEEILVEIASGGAPNSNVENWSAVITWKRIDAPRGS